MQDVQRLLRDMPEILDDAPEQEVARHAAVLTFRKCIAARWNYILELKDKVPSSHFGVLVQQMEKSLANLVEIHGLHVAFGPQPPDCLLGKGEDLQTPDQQSLRDSASFAGTSTSASSGPSTLPHQFKFLTLQRNKTEEVWTCCQAHG